MVGPIHTEPPHGNTSPRRFLSTAEPCPTVDLASYTTSALDELEAVRTCCQHLPWLVFVRS